MVNHRCAVLGKPIAHSLSPVLHNAAYRSLGLNDWFYDKHEVGEEELDSFLKGLDPSWAGLSLTMPLKKTIQPYGVPSNLWAKELRIANTAVFDWEQATYDDPAWPHGKPGIRLYNTDVVGIQLAFDNANRELGAHHGPDRKHNALIIGNGNTATSAAAACAMMQEIGHVTVVARHPGKNPGLGDVLGRFITTHHPYDEIPLSDAEAVLAAAGDATYVINTIPGHAADAVADTLAAAPAGTAPFTVLLLDVVYDPRPTKLMAVWRSRGGRAIGGEEMLLYQALVQVLLMTGIWDDDPPSDADRRLQDTTTEDDHLEIAMRRALEEAL